MQDEAPLEPDRNLRAYIATIRHHKWAIGVATLLTVAVTMLFTSRLTPVYTALTRVRVTPTGAQQITAPNAGIDMPTERAAAASSVVAQIVRKNLHLTDSAESLLGGESASQEPDTTFLDISYSDPSPQRAQTLSLAFAKAYLANRAAITNQQMAAIKANYEVELKQYRSELGHAYAALRRGRNPGGTITSRINFYTLEISNISNAIQNLTTLPNAAGIIFQAPPLPTSPTSPSYPQNIAMSFVLGLALGAGIAFLRDHLSEGLRGSSDLEGQVQAPVLAAIPHVVAWRRRDKPHLTVAESPRGPIAEAYRTLRTNLQFVASNTQGDEFKVISVVSPTLGEGKTTTVANLAATLAQVDKRVIAVSCDLRKPRLHKFFDLPNDVGLSTVLTGRATIGEAAQAPGGIETLRIIASGPIPPNPSELLGSAEMETFVAEARTFADFIIFDTPPVLAVADALILGPKTDGAILVADAHTTARGSVAHTREQLQQVGVRIVGCVFNNFDPARAKYYPYDYRYYYSSYAYRGKYSQEAPVPSDNGHETKTTAKEIWG